MRDLVFVGIGGQARELHALIEAIGMGWNPLGFLDDAQGQFGARVHGLRVLGGIDWLVGKPAVAVAVGAGVSPVRKHVVDQILALGPREFPALIHPMASVGPRVELGEGVLIGPGAVLTTDLRVGNHVLVNFGCTVGHDVVLDDFVTVAPGAHVSGAVHVGEGSDIGTGASIIQGVTVGDWSIVGAGAVVLEDVPADSTVVGVPARVIKRRESGWYREIG